MVISGIGGGYCEQLLEVLAAGSQNGAMGAVLLVTNDEDDIAEQPVTTLLVEAAEDVAAVIREGDPNQVLLSVMDHSPLSVSGGYLDRRQ